MIHLLVRNHRNELLVCELYRKLIIYHNLIYDLILRSPNYK